jgi:hypothetical protein
MPMPGTLGPSAGRAPVIAGPSAGRAGATGHQPVLHPQKPFLPIHTEKQQPHHRERRTAE